MHCPSFCPPQPIHNDINRIIVNTLLFFINVKCEMLWIPDRKVYINFILPLLAKTANMQGYDMMIQGFYWAESKPAHWFPRSQGIWLLTFIRWYWIRLLLILLNYFYQHRITIKLLLELVYCGNLIIEYISVIKHGVIWKTGCHKRIKCPSNENFVISHVVAVSLVTIQSQ